MRAIAVMFALSAVLAGDDIATLGKATSKDGATVKIVGTDDFNKRVEVSEKDCKLVKKGKRLQLTILVTPNYGPGMPGLRYAVYDAEDVSIDSTFFPNGRALSKGEKTRVNFSLPEGAAKVKLFWKD